MPTFDRRRSNNWSFSDAGSRFDANPRLATRDRMPIATTFSRKIIRCRRCNSRVVSNAKRCPYCGKSLVPFYRSFTFWCVVVACLAISSLYFIFFYNPTSVSSNGSDAHTPIAYGLIDRTDTSEMPIGTTIDCNGLMITVISVHQPYTTANGRPVYEVTVQIFNKSSSTQRLLTTQWVMRTADGGYADCYSGMTDSGNNVSSGVEGRQLAVDEVLTTRLYFATDTPIYLVYLVNPLNTEDGPDVSWLIGQQAPVGP